MWKLRSILNDYLHDICTEEEAIIDIKANNRIAKYTYFLIGLFIGTVISYYFCC